MKRTNNMTSVRHTIELHAKDVPYWVTFVRDVDGHWHAEVLLPDASSWHFSQEKFGPFHPCDQHAERLLWAAKGMVNSGRAA